jgi:transcriptional regulatory protein RtcR
MGPTGAGKSKLARRIYDLKKARSQVEGAFVGLNCATLKGDGAMSTLFGHVKGAFTGAQQDRQGLLRQANRGILFLDEIGELGLDEQTMLLHALEEKRFLPLGGDKETSSDFQLIAGTNRDLGAAVECGKFREDLLARINLWTFRLPGLSDRPEDLEPNIQYELDQFSLREGRKVTFSREAMEFFLEFATSKRAKWLANFRDLNAAITRMATLAPGGRIGLDLAREEAERLRISWGAGSGGAQTGLAVETLGAKAADALDLFDRCQLETVIRVCRESKNLSDAGRALFSESRKGKASPNDADRLRKYLARFGLDWASLSTAA